MVFVSPLSIESLDSAAHTADAYMLLEFIEIIGGLLSSREPTEVGSLVDEDRELVTPGFVL